MMLALKTMKQMHVSMWETKTDITAQFTWGSHWTFPTMVLFHIPAEGTGVRDKGCQCSSWAGEHIHMPRAGCTLTPWDRIFCTWGPPRPAPCALHLAVHLHPLLHNKLKI